ncbi:MAG: EI24 domain-containing protein [Pseudomonadota bacterium]
MIFSAAARALGQIDDPRFRSVFLRGIGLSLLLLIALAVIAGWFAGWLVPDTLTLPWIGQVHFVDTLASIGGVLAVLGLSVFLMVPVASAFTGLFLDTVANAVEEAHYPQLGPAETLGVWDTLVDSLRFLGVLVIANLLALFLYLIFIPFAPFIFWALNGFLLGREYFQMVAMRRLGTTTAAQMRRRHRLTIWGLGLVMAVPLSVPVINLAVPILGVAAFTHLYHALADRHGTPSA